MKALVIAKRELAEQKLVWAAAAYVALAGLVVPWLKPMGDIRGILGVGLNLGFVAAMSAVLGASMIPGDLQSGRMGFYFARPVSAGAMLLGRFLGAWLLVVGGGLLVALPQAALAPRNATGLSVVVAFSAVGSVYILLAAHALGTMFRSRSAWLLLDIAVLGAFGASMTWMTGHIAEGGAFRALPWFLGAAFLLVLPVLAGAVFLQLSRGGADLRRGHKVLSVSLALGLGAIALAGAGFCVWVRSGGPSSLSTFCVIDVAPSGGWITVLGEGRFHRQAFLLDTATGATVGGEPGGLFSPDGRRYVNYDLRMSQVVDIDLGQTPPRIQPPWDLAIPEPKGWSLVRALSSDGRLAVIITQDCLTVADVQARKVLHQSRGKREFLGSRFAFLSGTLLREFGRAKDGSAPIRELDLTTGVWTETGRIPGTGQPIPDATARQVLTAAPDGILVCDGRTGKELWRIPRGEGRPVRPRFCGDGSVALLEQGPDGQVLRVLDASGRERWTRSLDGSKGMTAWLLPDPGTGRVLVALLEPGASPGDMAGRKGRIVAADLAKGTLETVAGDGSLALGLFTRNAESPLASLLRVGAGGGLFLAGPGGSSRTLIPGARWGWTS